MDKQAVHDELDRARRDFHELLARADAAALRAPSDGTRWTNRQLLFHMLFGYLIVRALRPLVKGQFSDPKRGLADVQLKPGQMLPLRGRRA